MKKFFILGNPRSGTSLFRLMLNAHPNIVVPPECGFVQWLSEKYSRRSFVSNKNNIYMDFLRDVKNSKKMETWGLDFDKILDRFLKERPSRYTDACAIIYHEYAIQNGMASTSIWGDKNNYYIDYLDLLNELYPDAFFVHIIRDGRDVAASYLDMNKISDQYIYKPKLSDNVLQISKEWNQNNRKILDFFDKQPTNKTISIRFEDLLSDSEFELTKVCDLLGVEYVEDMLKYHQKDIGEPNDTIAWKKKTREKPDKGVVSRYKNVLTKEEINAFNSESEDILFKFRYL